jgi:hypothetical protein
MMAEEEKNMTTEDATRECPFCKEEIKAGSIKCKHCHSAVKPEIPPHGGICPFCKEEIKPEAIKCKHCGSMVGGSAESSCCEGCAQKGASGLGTSSSVGTNNPFPFPTEVSTEGTIARQSSGCTQCFSNGIRGNRYCCVRICVPSYGCWTSCWVEPCFPAGTIFV